MATCVNERCSNNPFNSSTCIIINQDGDAACGPECAKEYRKQMNHFCSCILPDDRKFAQWLGVPEEWIKL